MTHPHPLRLWKSLTLGGVVGMNFGFVLVVIAWDWPQWWVNINYERSALTWFSSMQLLCIALSAWGTAFLQELRGRGATRESWVWRVTGAGFVYLSLDERFQFHERLRESVLKPHQIATHLPGIEPGNVVLLGYALVGILLAVPLFRSLRGRASQAWLLAAVGVAAMAVGMDAIDLSDYPNQVQRVEQFWEEILETIAQMAFLLAFVLHGWNLMEAIHGTIADRDHGRARP